MMMPELPMTEPLLHVNISTHIALVTLNRPEKRNAVNAALSEALEAIVRRTESDADRCAGPESFRSSPVAASAIPYDQQRYRGRHLIENAFCVSRISVASPPATTLSLPISCQASRSPLPSPSSFERVSTPVLR